jgi:hypothetical protein
MEEAHRQVLVSLPISLPFQSQQQMLRTKMTKAAFLKLWIPDIDIRRCPTLKLRATVHP